MHRTATLSKHHGLGNDFLVWLTLSPDSAPDPGHLPALAAAWCHRRHGVGADGLIVGYLADDVDRVMVLHNADGSRAEMSGNGIRCLAQAEARSRVLDSVDLTIATDAGRRDCVVLPGPDPATATVRVDMGPATCGPASERVAAAVAKAEQAAEVDLGNPHLVLLEGAEPLDLEALGRAWPDRNVEVIRSVADDVITMDVWERGVGRTEACGTGAGAAAAAAAGWGLVGERPVVRMPGGDLEVVLGDSISLAGPATHIADVEVWA